MTDVLGTVAMLALAVKGAYDGVQGNKMQCELLNDHVQRVATVLRGIAPSMMKDISSNPAISSLVETLRSAADLITGFKKKNWLKKVVLHASVGAKFEDLFMELDRVLNVCGFAFEVWASLAYFRCFPPPIYYSHRHHHHHRYHHQPYHQHIPINTRLLHVTPPASRSVRQILIQKLI